MGKVTFSIIKADVGSAPGHTTVHEDLLDVADGFLAERLEGGLFRDYVVSHCGDDLALILTHDNGADDEEIHTLAWDCFQAATERAKELHLYGAGQDLLSDAFSGNVRGLGPGAAEFEFTERPSEPICAFLCDKTAPGAFNFPMYKMWADPFNTPGLIIDTNLHAGFRFEIWDILEEQRIFLDAPEELYDILSLIGSPGRFVIKRVWPKEGHKLPADEPVAVVSTETLAEVAGEYVGKDDPVAAVRAQSGLPAMGEVLEAFTFAHLVPGQMRGSHTGPLLPITLETNRVGRFDGPPRILGLGFQLKDGELVGPVDLFDDPSFDKVRDTALELNELMRRHGPFEPHLLPLEEREYTTITEVIGKLRDRFEDVDEVEKVAPEHILEVGDVD